MNVIEYANEKGILPTYNFKDSVFAKHDQINGTVMLNQNKAGRQYRVATESDYVPVWKPQQVVAKLAKEKLPNGISLIPGEPLPPQGTLGFRVQLYGMTQWGDLFTARQKLALSTVARLVSVCELEGSSSTVHLLAAALSRLADKDASLAVWNQIGEKIEHVFGRQALPIVWDFAEVAIFSESTGNFQSGIELVQEVAEHGRPPTHWQAKLRQQMPANFLCPTVPAVSGSLIHRTMTRFHTPTFQTSFTFGSDEHCRTTR